MVPSDSPKPYMPLWGGRHPLHDKFVRAFVEYGHVAVVARVLKVGRATATRWKAHPPNWAEVMALRRAQVSSPLEQRVAALERAVAQLGAITTKPA